MLWKGGKIVGVGWHGLKDTRYKFSSEIFLVYNLVYSIEVHILEDINLDELRKVYEKNSK